MTFDHPSSIAEWVESNLLWDEKALLPEDYARIIKDISASDIVAFMQSCWDLSKKNLTVQGPIGETKIVDEKYQSMLEKLADPGIYQVQEPLYS